MLVTLTWQVVNLQDCDNSDKCSRSWLKKERGPKQLLHRRKTLQLTYISDQTFQIVLLRADE